MESIDWESLATGMSGDIELEQAWLRWVGKIYEIFCRKQHDYGPKNIGLGKLPGIILRVSDKISRLWELSGMSTGQVKDTQTGESLEDALIDMADYGVIGLMVMAGDWPLLSIDDAFGNNAKVEYISSIMEMLNDSERDAVISRFVGN